MIPEKPSADHVSHRDEPELKDSTRLAEASRAEHEIGVWDAVKLNPKIVLLTAVTQIGPFMYGFDAIAFSICFAMPSFQ